MNKQFSAVHTSPVEHELWIAGGVVHDELRPARDGRQGLVEGVGPAPATRFLLLLVAEPSPPRNPGGSCLNSPMYFIWNPVPWRARGLVGQRHIREVEARGREGGAELPFTEHLRSRSECAAENNAPQLCWDYVPA